jgi:NTE family protein
VKLALASLLFFVSVARAFAGMDLSSDALLRDHLWRDVTSRPKGKRPVVGLVLSAGSLRGTAHVGVITVLEQAGFPIDVVAGTSMGSIVGSLYAGGRPVKRLWEMATAMTVGTGNNLNTVRLLSLVLRDKLLSSKKTEEIITKELGNMRFEQMPKPFACVAMDIYTGEEVVFHEGEVGPAVRASMNLPGIFEPVAYRHRYLVDGGVVNYIPVSAAKMLGAEWVIASITENDYRAQRPRTVLDSLSQVIDIRGTFLSREQRRAANFLIEPPVGDIAMHEANRVPEAMGKGVIEANRLVKPAMESLILSSLNHLMKDWER